MKKILLIIITLFVIINMNSQSNDDFAPTIHSPQVSALYKFTEFPISLYTGQGEVSVPIYDMKVGDISVPISLQYHTGGVRVEDMATWVGMNWSLSAGGQISRQINGKPDTTFDPDFFYKEPPFAVVDYVSVHPGTILNENGENLLDAARGLIDTEHDIFHYSAGNYSGKFIIDHKNGGEIVTIPKQDVVIDHNFSGMTIKTPDGLVYFYGLSERNKQSSLCNPSGYSPANFRPTEPLAWFLTRIESSTTKAFVDFNYEFKNLIYEQNGSQTINETFATGSLGSAPPNNSCVINNDITTYRLTSISSSDGQLINFNIGAERKDLLGDYLLENIDISHTNSISSKKFNLKHKYQRGSGLYELTNSLINNTNPEELRLFLMGVEEVDQNNNTIPIADYTYHLNYGLPSRRSFAQDHSGYYNGYGNSTLVPPTYFQGVYLSGGNRTSRFDYAKEGSLISIKTGTGGERNYTYGPNICTNCVTYTNSNPSTPSYTTESTYDFNIPSTGSNPIVLEKTFTMNGYGEITFRFEGDEAFYPIGSSINAEAKLILLNSDGSNQVIFSSTQRREEIEYTNNGQESFYT